jgi:3-oxoacyl-[acyl-carrier protein] reductase
VWLVIVSDLVLVTGASGGIGAAIVERLASRGYSLVGLDAIAPPRAVRKRLSGFMGVDLLDPSALEAACDEVRNNQPRLWALVFCAGMYPIRRFDEYSITLWEQVHAVNVNSIFSACLALSSRLRRGGRIVIISSGAAHVGSLDPGYSSSKAGALGLSRSLARTFGKRQILVNAIAPGVIDTQMSRRMSNARKQAHIHQTVLGRVGRPAEVAICVDFLLDRSNTYMTGATLDVNGGLYLR